ncbi:MAG TPA: glycoside hydrolase family 130 protein [Terriglobales bacterium]|nr:glycoside hydrolase family 130 protein [Terriglobales bacterium]
MPDRTSPNLLAPLAALLALAALAPLPAPARQRPAAPARAGWQLGPFVRTPRNPILAPDPAALFAAPGQPAVRWEALHVFNPAAIVRGGKVVLLYRAEDDTGAAAIGGHVSRIGWAESADGVHFRRRPQPVLFPAADAQSADERGGGCEDPRVVAAPGGLFVMTYTQWNRRQARLAIATSRDLIHWLKRGPAFAELGGAWARRWTKSGAIVTALENGRLRAVKIGGRYWMYWGDQGVRIATSTNLIDWQPGPVVLPPRPGRFDSALTEPGAPALLTQKGIVLLYNAMNARTSGDPSLPAGRYAAGQALFSAAAPARLLARTARPFFAPAAGYETNGQYGAGTTFLEGLVHFHRAWFLYYGAADSRVAVWRPPQP